MMGGTFLGHRVVHFLVLLLVLTFWRRSHAGDETSRDVSSFRTLELLMPTTTESPNSRNLVNDTSACPAEGKAQVLCRGGACRGDTVASPTLTFKEKLLMSKKKKQGKYEFSLFQKGDGSEEDPDGIPTRYQLMFPGSRQKAQEALEATLAWRKEHNVDTLLRRPLPKFDVAKIVFPHYFANRDKSGHVVFVQRPGMLNLELAKKNSLTKEELLEHYVYVNEYLWQVVESKSPMATLFGIMDLQGVNLRTLRQKEVISFLKIFVSTMDSHFPQRAHKTMLVNAPKWFNLVYKLLSPLLRESTKEKIQIFSRGKKQDKELKSVLGNDAEKLLPKSFFSEKKKKKKRRKRKRDVESDEDDEEEQESEEFVIPHTDLEQQLRSFVSARLKDGGASMKGVVRLSS